MAFMMRISVEAASRVAMRLNVLRCIFRYLFLLNSLSALGRADGEDYNIGFIDVCHRLYDELISAARATPRASLRRCFRHRKAVQ